MNLLCAELVGELLVLNPNLLVGLRGQVFLREGRVLEHLVLHVLLSLSLELEQVHVVEKLVGMAVAHHLRIEHLVRVGEVARQVGILRPIHHTVVLHVVLVVQLSYVYVPIQGLLLLIGPLRVGVVIHCDK